MNATSAIEDETQPILGINHFTKGERERERGIDNYQMYNICCMSTKKVYHLYGIQI